MSAVTTVLSSESPHLTPWTVSHLIHLHSFVITISRCDIGLAAFDYHLHYQPDWPTLVEAKIYIYNGLILWMVSCLIHIHFVAIFSTFVVSYRHDVGLANFD